MAPAQTSAAQQEYKVGEKVLCFHGELLYEAKILDTKLSDPADRKSHALYNVHYKGWKKTWDDWVAPDRIRKDTEENKDLARNLKQASDASRRPAPAKSVSSKVKGSDELNSNGGEEKTPARSKRARELELDNVCDDDFESDFLQPDELSRTKITKPRAKMAAKQPRKIVKNEKPKRARKALTVGTRERKAGVRLCTECRRWRKPTCDRQIGEDARPCSFCQSKIDDPNVTDKTRYEKCHFPGETQGS